MKNHTMFNFNFLFNDHFAKISNQAKLYYIKLNFFADNGFVPNPLEVLDSLNYDRGVLNELIRNEEIITVPDRSEVFIKSYFIHNPGIKPFSWRATPYAVYWENRLFVKKNGIVDFDPNGLKRSKETDPLDKIKVATETESEVYNEIEPPETNEVDVIEYLQGGNKDEAL